MSSVKTNKLHEFTSVYSLYPTIVFNVLIYPVWIPLTGVAYLLPKNPFYDPLNMNTPWGVSILLANLYPKRDYYTLLNLFPLKYSNILSSSKGVSYVLEGRTIIESNNFVNWDTCCCILVYYYVFNLVNGRCRSVLDGVTESEAIFQLDEYLLMSLFLISG